MANKPVTHQDYAKDYTKTTPRFTPRCQALRQALRQDLRQDAKHYAKLVARYAYQKKEFFLELRSPRRATSPYHPPS